VRNDNDDDDKIGGKNVADDCQGIILTPSKQMFVWEATFVNLESEI